MNLFCADDNLDLGEDDFEDFGSRFRCEGDNLDFGEDDLDEDFGRYIDKQGHCCCCVFCCCFCDDCDWRDDGRANKR